MSHSMEVYGLTGGIGAGKSAVAELLQEYGIPVVSADELSRLVVAPGSAGLQDVVEAFGDEVLGERGELDRGRMAAIVFRDPDRRRKLEAILHPRIRERYEQVLNALAQAGHRVAVYEVPLLFEKNLQGDMKGVILVTAPDALRVARVVARDESTEDQVRARMKAQMPEDEKRRRADYILENTGDLDDLRREVHFLLARYLRVYDAPALPILERAAPSVSAPAENLASAPASPSSRETLPGIHLEDVERGARPSPAPPKAPPPPPKGSRAPRARDTARAPSPQKAPPAAQPPPAPPPPKAASPSGPPPPPAPTKPEG